MNENDERDSSIDACSIEAKCMDMCPEIECLKREKERLIHILETDYYDYNAFKNKKLPRTSTRSKMIKSYYRCAAGQDLTKPELLRPPEVLFQTLDYIFTKIIHDKRVNRISLYNFVDDRLRSIKQDGIVQRLSSEAWFHILVPLVHFYVHSAYNLCEESSTDFDQKLNKDQLIDCLYRFIKTYENRNSDTYSIAYAEMEAFYLIINLDNVETINRAFQLDITHNVFQLTLKLVLCCYNRNYCAVFRLLEKLPVLPAGLFVALHLNKIRKNALEAMSYAYSCKNISYPVSELKNVLVFNSKTEAVNECKFYDISTVNNDEGVKFVKKQLKSDLAGSKRMNYLDLKLKNIQLSELIFSK